MNKLRKIIIISFITCVMLTNICSLYAASTPSIEAVKFQGHSSKTDNSGRFYLMPYSPDESTNNCYVIVECYVFNNTSNPVVYFDGKKVGTMTPNTRVAKNYYEMYWNLSKDQYGSALGGPKDFTIKAAGVNGTVGYTKKIYITGGSYLYYDKYMYNWKKDWNFVAPASKQYNSLAYVLGKQTWIWPWKNSNGTERDATAKEVIKYMESQGYKQTSSASGATIIAYGPSQDKIRHFGYRVSSSQVIHKFKDLELMSSSSVDAFKYNSGSGIGYPQLYFKK